jgi:hypothetical protein
MITANERPFIFLITTIIAIAFLVVILEISEAPEVDSKIQSE